MYGWTSGFTGLSQLHLVALATLSAFIGAFAGARLLQKVTLRGVQMIVSALLALISFGLLTGLL